MPNTTQLIAAYEVVAERNFITNPDRILCSPRLRREFLNELNLTLDEDEETIVFHQLLNLRKRKQLKKSA